MATLVKEWVVVGAGPSGRSLGHLETHLLENKPNLIAVDTAIWPVPWHCITHWLCPQPGEFHFDPKQNANPFIGMMRAKAKIIVWRLSEKMRSQPWFDSIEWLEPVLDGTPKGFVPCDPVHIGKDTLYGWAPGTYVLPHWDPCGPLAVQYAVNNGATRVDIYGFEGRDRKTRAGARRHDGTREFEIQRRILQCVAKASPQTRFYLYGDLMYELEGNNVQIHKEAIHA